MEDPRSALYLAISQIPEGRVTNYGTLARLAGAPNGARWAGRVLSQLPKDSTLPWHRVVNSQGRISLPGARGAKQVQLLKLEGVTVCQNRIDMKTFGWLP